MKIRMVVQLHRCVGLEERDDQVLYHHQGHLQQIEK